jgi:DNA (cytosine-5)-methyltransferase 1
MKQNPPLLNIASSPIAIDLFSGAGGLSCGLEQAGYRILYANEYQKQFAETYKLNHPFTEVSTEDIRELDPRKIRKSLGLAVGELDLIAGGPPCQGFSINAPVRSELDARNHLFLDFIRFVKEFKPKNVIIENVPGIVSYSSGDTVRAILTSLELLGYKVDISILCAAHYGVPQGRWRTIIVGRKNAKTAYTFPNIAFNGPIRANFTTKLDGKSLLLAVNPNSEIKKFVTVEDAIADLPKIGNAGGQKILKYTRVAKSEYAKDLRFGSEVLHNHQCAGLGPDNLERAKHIPPGGSWRDIPHDLLPEGMKKARKSDHTKRYGRLSLKGLSSTILTKPDPHWGAFIHPLHDRVLSVREAARLQSFPDNFAFTGNLKDQYTQVGNAVPPILGREIGLSLLQ